MANYFEKLKDPRWQKLRLEVLQRENFTCQWCQSTTKTLHVHHGYYSQGADPWEYHECFLHCLCDECHEAATDAIKGMRRSIAVLRTREQYRVATRLLNRLVVCGALGLESNLLNYGSTLVGECLICWDEDHDQRLLSWVESLEQQDNLSLAHEHEGSLFLLWKGDVPAGFAEGQCVNVEGEAWTIVKSQAFLLA